MYRSRILFIPAYTFIFVVFVFSQLWAQQPSMPPIDFETFREAVAAEQSHDAKIQRYVEMSMRAARFYPDSVKAFADEVGALSGLNEAEKEGFRNFILANAWLPGNPDSAVFYGERAIDRLRETGAAREFIFTANLLGGEYSRRQEYVKAEAVYVDAIEYGSSTNERDGSLNFVYGNLGSLYAMVGLHDRAIEMFERFLEKEDNPANRCNTISKLAMSLMEIDELEQARDLLAGCLEYSELPPPIRAIVRANLSRIVEKTGDNVRAIKLMEEAASISVGSRIANLEVTQPIALGHKYLEAGKIAKADSIRTLLESFPARTMRPNLTIDKAVFQAHLYLARGENDKAVEHADTAIRLAGRHGMRYQLKDVYNVKAEAHENRGEMDRAIENLRRQRELENLQHNRATERNLAMMKVRYQLQNKEEQLSAVTRELGTVKIRTAVLILSIILLGLYAAYRARMHFLFKEEKTRNKIAGDLHDEVSGSLSSISYFAEAITRSDPEQKNNKFVTLIKESAGEAKDKITDIIWAINTEQDSWQSLLSKCHRFASDLLESKDISYRIDIPDQISGKPGLEVKQNVWLIFKEILTNAARHSSASRVDVTIGAFSGVLKIVVEDNGTGFDVSKKSAGNGLRNIFLRAEKINAEANLHSDKETGTRWEVEVSL